jgi:hypothetical protein
MGLLRDRGQETEDHGQRHERLEQCDGGLVGGNGLAAEVKAACRALRHRVRHAAGFVPMEVLWLLDRPL